MFRLISLLILLLLSLLNVFKAPAYPFWLAAIFVAEYGWICMLVVLVLLPWGICNKRFLLPCMLTGIIAGILFIWPVISAGIISAQLDGQMNRRFPDSAPAQRDTPFSILKLLARVNTQSYHTINYASYNDTVLSLDYYKVTGSPVKRPCVVVIHGGSWSGGDSRQLPELNSILTQKGYQVASVNYRLAPAHPYPAAVNDVRKAINYLKTNAERLDIDTTKMVLLGRSAGGQLALLAAYQQPDAGIRGVVSFYGPADMVWGYQVPANPLVFNSRQIMERYLGGAPAQVNGKYRESSPIEYVTRHTVPTLLIHGENDVLVSYGHSKRLEARLQQCNVSHYLLSLPWATHGFDYHLYGPGGQLSTYAVLYFLRAVTR